MTGSLSGRPVVTGKPVVKGTQVLVGNVLGAGDAVQVILGGYLNITRENLLSAVELRRPAITIRKGAVRGIQSVKFLLDENVPKSGADRLLCDPEHTVLNISGTDDEGTDAPEIFALTKRR